MLSVAVCSPVSCKPWLCTPEHPCMVQHHVPGQTCVHLSGLLHCTVCYDYPNPSGGA